MLSCSKPSLESFLAPVLSPHCRSLDRTVVGDHYNLPPKMGACMSSNSDELEQKKKSQAIDRILEEDSKKLRRECKILLLGASAPVRVHTRRSGTKIGVASQDPGRVASLRLSSR